MALRAGRLRHTVTIEAPTEDPNEYGEPEVTWTPVATVWAVKEDLTGREAFAAQQVHAETTTRFRIRYREVNAKMRLIHFDTVYNILSVQDPTGLTAEIVLICSRAS